MIFAGDVAIAEGDRFEFRGFPVEIRKKEWCINLEGAIAQQSQVLDWGVYNASDWSESFSGFKLGAAFLANNHVDDVPDGIAQTQKLLPIIGVQYFGAGEGEQQAARPAFIGSGLSEYILVGFGWPVVGCRPVTKYALGVNPLEGGRVMRIVEALLKEHPNARVVVVMHWNYELEYGPQPGHRRLARALIDRGAYAVVGHHPHIVGPIERYRRRTIAYSLGNWAFSDGRFFGGRLRFPRSTFAEIALELGDNADVVHHAQFEPPARVRYLLAEIVQDKALSLTPEFEGMSDREYVTWFSSNRLKRKGLPIYLSADASVANWLKDGWVATRQLAIDSAGKMGIKSIRRKG